MFVYTILAPLIFLIALLTANGRLIADGRDNKKQKSQKTGHPKHPTLQRTQKTPEIDTSFRVNSIDNKIIGLDHIVPQVINRSPKQRDKEAERIITSPKT